VAQFDELGRKRGERIHHLGNFFYAWDVRRAVGFREADADHRAPAEGNDDATAHERLAVEGSGHGVGERRAQRNR
jgi:hypothetical protein